MYKGVFIAPMSPNELLLTMTDPLLHLPQIGIIDLITLYVVILKLISFCR